MGGISSIKLIAFGAIALCFSACGANAKCVARTISPPGESEQVSTLVVADSDLKQFEDAGYQEASCQGVSKATYRDNVCRPKFFGNSGVQRQLEIQTGFSFAKLCATAQQEAGLPASKEPVPLSLGSNNKPNLALPINSRRPIVGPLANTPTSEQMGGQ
jgi:hypothetical protein